MRSLGVFLVLLSLGYYGFTRFSHLKNYRYVSLPEVESELGSLGQQIRRHDETLTLPPGGTGRMDEMRREKVQLWFEVQRRRYHADWWVPVLTLLGLILAFSPFALRLPRRRKEPKARIPRDFEESIGEAPSREEYVDEWEFQKRTEGGFQQREEALEWLMKDPLLRCDYCGARLKSTFAGEREALQLVTFYRKPPPGAKDLRIILGSCWFPLAASELKCTGCERVVRR